MSASTDVPARIARLPRDQRGYPVPFFVEWVDGVPDFRVMDGRKLVRAVKERRCWICGDVLGVHLAFVIGPMCSINRISAEPPSHQECAEYAVSACPFLSNPDAPRRETRIPDGAHEPAGNMIRRNPGVTMIWTTRSYRILQPDGRGWLFEIGPPEKVAWFKEGRPASRAEVLESIDSGYPILADAADVEGLDSRRHLEARKAEAMALLPAS